MTAISPGARRRLRQALAATDAEETLRWELLMVADRLGEVTERLFDRLPPGTVDEVRRRLSADEARFWASMDATQQKRLAIAFATQMAFRGSRRPPG